MTRAQRAMLKRLICGPIEVGRLNGSQLVMLKRMAANGWVSRYRPEGQPRSAWRIEYLGKDALTALTATDGQ
jgi:hypothetical protein